MKWEARGLGMALLLSLEGLACGARTAVPAPPETPESSDDGGRCDFRGRTDRQQEQATLAPEGPPSIRRVFAVSGEGVLGSRRLVCREIDTNLDGKKDVFRYYSDGELSEEIADSNYDGQVDTWVRFAGGVVAQFEADLTGDGEPDEVREYQNGRLRRIRRDTNRDGQPDVWEVYSESRLQRLGVDMDYDGRVDHWSRTSDKPTSRPGAPEER